MEGVIITFLGALPIAGLVTLHLFQVRRNGYAVLDAITGSREESIRLVKKHASKSSIFESLSYTYRLAILEALRRRDLYWR